MVERIFELPRQDQLTPDQRKVLRLPKDGQYLIVGAPGTGKSVVALMRLKKFIEEGNVQFLTYNHVLNHANKCLVDESCSESMDTATSWFYSLYWDSYKEFVPEIKKFQPDYQAVIKNFNDQELRLENYSIIIDEGQDLPRGWYEAVENLHIANFFVVADQNQQITEVNSSRQDIEDALGLESNEVIELKENWRNSTPIALFCSHFYTDNASPKPAVPTRPSVNVPILYEYDRLDSVKEQILQEYDFDPSKLIGIFVATDTRREYWIRTLRNDGQRQKRNNPPPVISSYSAGQKGQVNIDFSRGGIVVLNDTSVKGIEFDTVFIQTDGFKQIFGDAESLKKRLYVMSSRAREKLYLFKSKIYETILDDILPSEGETVTYIPKNGNTEITVELLKRRSL